MKFRKSKFQICPNLALIRILISQFAPVPTLRHLNYKEKEKKNVIEIWNIPKFSSQSALISSLILEFIRASLINY